MTDLATIQDQPTNLALAGRVANETASQHVFAGSHRYILDYLAEEVLHRQPERVQTFLLQTSILDRLTGPLCDAVTDQDDGSAELAAGGQATLERLERANLFIVPLDDERRWYRYHHLFADLLRSRLQRTYPNLIPALHHRASEWYEHSGLMSAAIEHALAAQDFERAALLIEPAAWPAIQQGEYSTLRRWLETLPENALYARPQLCLMYAWGLIFAGEIEAYERPLAAAERIWQEEGNDAKLGQVLNLRADMALSRNQHDAGIILARQALELLDEGDSYNRSLSWLYLGGAYVSMGELGQARQAMGKSRAMSEASGNIYAYTASGNILGKVLMAQGRLGQAAELFRQTMRLADDATLFGGLGAQVFLSTVLLEWNDLDAAERHLRHALELLEQTGLEIYAGIGYTIMALLLQARGRAEQARDFIERGICIGRELGDLFRERQARAVKAQIALAQGDLAVVTHWRETCGIAPDDDVNDYRRGTEYFILAQAFVAEGSAGAARVIPLLSRLRARAVAQEQVDSEIKILVITALAYQAIGDLTAALQSLEHALTLAEPGGYVRVFVNKGAPMARLLRQAAGQGIVFSDRLLPALRDDLQAAASPLVEALTRREMEVLRLVSVGFTNREIAQELVIAPGTVKVHIKHIYNKLGVANRTQAAARARELELF